MIVCLCAGVTEATLDRVIAEGASSVSEVTRRCGAGRSCAPCRQEIQLRLYTSTVPPENRVAERGASCVA